MLRPREPRVGHPRRHALHGDDRRAPARDRRQDRQDPLGHGSGQRRRTEYSITHAPLVVKDKIIVGMAGGDRGVRGFIAAYDARTGKEVWRFYTIPGPGEPGNETWSGDSWKTGGAGVWNSGAYDAEANLVYFGTGNPWPDREGRAAPRRQPVQRQRRRARSGHRQAEVALPVHAARPDGLRLHAGADPRRHASGRVAAAR